MAPGCAEDPGERGRNQEARSSCFRRVAECGGCYARRRGRSICHRPIALDPVAWAVLASDGHACQLCGTRRNLEVHHLRHRSRGGKDAQENLITLCHHCHAAVHAGLTTLGEGRK